MPNFAIHENLAANFLRANDVEPIARPSSGSSSPEEIAKRAKRSTLRLSCQTVAVSKEGTYRVVGVANNDLLNVRKGPSTDAPLVAVLVPGTTGIEVIHYQEIPGQSPWALIRHGANEGWVNSRYLSC